MAKFCMECGKENPDNGKFCKGCGAALYSDANESAGPKESDNKSNEQQNIYTPPYQAAVKKSRLPLFIGLGIAAAAVIIIVAIFLSNASKTINLQDYMNVEYTGYNGYATARANVDNTLLRRDIFKALGYSESDLNDMYLFGVIMFENGIRDNEIVVEMMNSVNTSLDKSSNLKNGDQITARITYNGSEANWVNFVDGEITVEVKELPEAKKIDPFENITVKFTGVAPYGIAVAEGTDSLKESGITFRFDNDENLSEGDTVTLFAEYDENSGISRGIVLIQNSKEYTVDKLEDALIKDVFADANVTFEGTAPFAKIKYNNKGSVTNGEETISIEYSADKKKNLSIGDTITLTADYDHTKMAKAGMQAESDTKTITISADQVDHYIQDVNEINDEILAVMQKECTDKLEAYFAQLCANKSAEGFAHSNERYVGSYIITRKSPTWGDTNYLYLVYEGTVAPGKNSKFLSEQEVFYVFKLSNLRELTNGTQSFDDGKFKMIDVNNKNLEVYSIHYLDAYSNGQAVFNDIVVKNKDKYTYSVSEELKQYGE